MSERASERERTRDLAPEGRARQRVEADLHPASQLCIPAPSSALNPSSYSYLCLTSSSPASSGLALPDFIWIFLPDLICLVSLRRSLIPWIRGTDPPTFWVEQQQSTRRRQSQQQKRESERHRFGRGERERHTERASAREREREGDLALDGLDSHRSPRLPRMPYGRTYEPTHH